MSTPEQDRRPDVEIIGGPREHGGPIHLAEPDPAWPASFEREASRIRTALGDRARAVEHVGSTSVPDLAAKPIVDVVLVVADSAAEDDYRPALEAAGYVLRIREPGWYEHRVFKGPDTDVNLHVFGAGCREVERMIAFRDLLRADDAARRRYEATKRRLAGEHWRFVQDYADAKTAVIDELLGERDPRRRDAPPGAAGHPA